MSGAAWEVEPTLPGLQVLSRVLVCHECGAILKRIVDNGPARVVGIHADTCAERLPEYGQRELFA
jgi:hypothetical protein